MEVVVGATSEQTVPVAQLGFAGLHVGPGTKPPVLLPVPEFVAEVVVVPVPVVLPEVSPPELLPVELCAPEVPPVLVALVELVVEVEAVELPEALVWKGGGATPPLQPIAPRRVSTVTPIEVRVLIMSGGLNSIIGSIPRDM
jgi:hypothetical protein